MKLSKTILVGAIFFLSISTALVDPTVTMIIGFGLLLAYYEYDPK